MKHHGTRQVISINIILSTTPKGDLATILHEIVKKEEIEGGLDIKVVENAGIKIR